MSTRENVASVQFSRPIQRNTTLSKNGSVPNDLLRHRSCVEHSAWNFPRTCKQKLVCERMVSLRNIGTICSVGTLNSRLFGEMNNWWVCYLFFFGIYVPDCIYKLKTMRCFCHSKHSFVKMNLRTWLTGHGVQCSIGTFSRRKLTWHEKIRIILIPIRCGDFQNDCFLCGSVC